MTPPAEDRSERPQVVTRNGPVRGVADENSLRFLGIPFAAPPVGALRFAPPAPAAPWQNERDASAFGPAPLQPVDDLSITLGLLRPDTPQSEDCLTLNVFTPIDATSGARKAVMVWLHGGAFQTGTAASPVYDGSALAAAADVVVVTFNYRVGALGFGAPGPPESANLGLQDQVAALRWVRDEIASFGGDPDRVTVFGESAGAGSLVSLLAMPSARGLFGRAIVQSAAPEGVLSVPEAQERFVIFASHAGVSAIDLEQLRGLSADTIVTAQARCQEPGPRRIGMFFAPSIDGTVLPTAPLDAIAAGSAADVELIIGTTAQEMQLYHLAPGFADIPEAFLPQYLATRVGGPKATALERATTLLRAYDDVPVQGLDRFFALETDASLFIPATRLAEAQSRYQPRTFMYRFAYSSPLEGGKLGGCHALDVAFALANIDRVPEFAGSGPAAERVCETMVSAWSGFARTGDPSPAGLRWPPYTAARRMTLILDDPATVVDAPCELQRLAWERAA